jgi:ABC-type glutathione transport system ATPase component
MNVRPGTVDIAAPAEDGLAKGDLLMEVRNVSLRFGGVRAISDVSFDVREGECVGVQRQLRLDDGRSGSAPVPVAQAHRVHPAGR